MTILSRFNLDDVPSTFSGYVLGRTVIIDGDDVVFVNAFSFAVLQLRFHLALCQRGDLGEPFADHGQAFFVPKTRTQIHVPRRFLGLFQFSLLGRHTQPSIANAKPRLPC